jgi:Protein of unknown function (DUF3667)
MSREPVTSVETEPVAVDAPEAPVETQVVCLNCGAPMLGPFCYSCGQDTKSLVRNFSALAADFFDAVFNLDSRFFHTIGPLLFQPGFLTMEYLAGRRARYVSPVRLYFVISLVTFLFAQWTSPDITNEKEKPAGKKKRSAEAVRVVTKTAVFDEDGDVAAPDSSDIEESDDEDDALADGGINAPASSFGVYTGSDEEDEPGDGGVANKPSGPRFGIGIRIGDADANGNREHSISINGKPWDAVKNPIVVEWLPAFGNRALNRVAQRVDANVARVAKDPNILKSALLSSMPTALLLLLPLFALVLKLLYVFTRKIYMEHLLAALHVHAFVCLAVFVTLILNLIQSNMSEGLISTVLSYAFWGFVFWVPLYVFLLQKRVYQQSWKFTFFKFGILSFVYSIQFAFGLALLMVGTLAWM